MIIAVVMSQISAEASRALCDRDEDDCEEAGKLPSSACLGLVLIPVERACPIMIPHPRHCIELTLVDTSLHLVLADDQMQPSLADNFTRPRFSRLYTSTITCHGAH